MSRIDIPAYLVSLVLFAATYGRIYYGVEPTDEGQAVGWLYGPAIGFKPFVNEYFIQQTAALPFAPLSYFYHKIMGNEGVVLFYRHLFILTSALSSFCVYLFSKRLVSRPLAVLLTAVTFSFIPFSFPALYYNNAAYVLLTASLFLGAAAMTEKSEKKFLLTGILFGSGVFCYPPLAVAGAVFFIGVFAYFKKKRSSTAPHLKNLALGALIPCAAGGALLVSFGIENLKESLEFSRDFNAGGGLDKIIFIWKGYAGMFPDLWKVAALFATGFIGHGFRIFPFPWVLLFFPLITKVDPANPHWGGVAFSAHYLSLAAAPVIFFIFRKRVRPELAVIFFVSLVAGLMMAWSSSNGFPNMGAGCYPGVVSSAILFAALTDGRETRFRFGGKHAGLFIFLVCLSFGGKNLYSNYGSVYRDDAIVNLDTRVKGGPFAGLMTTSERAEFIGQIRKDVDEFSNGRNSILFYDSFPAGYLFSELKPTTRSLFIHTNHLRSVLAEFHSREENLPDVVFEFDMLKLSRKHIVLFNIPPQNPDRRNFENFLIRSRKNGARIMLVRERQQDKLREFFAKRSDYTVAKRRLFYRVLLRKNK